MPWDFKQDTGLSETWSNLTQKNTLKAFTNILFPSVFDFDDPDAQLEELNTLILDYKNRHNINQNKIYKTAGSVEEITWHIRFIKQLKQSAIHCS